MILNIKNLVYFVYKAFALFAVSNSTSKGFVVLNSTLTVAPINPGLNYTCITLSIQKPIEQTNTTDYAATIGLARYEEATVNLIEEDIYVYYSQMGSTIVTRKYKNDKLHPKFIEAEPFDRVYSIYDYNTSTVPPEYFKASIQPEPEAQKAWDPIIFSTKIKSPTYLCTVSQHHFFKMERQELRSVLCALGLVSSAQCLKDGVINEPEKETSTPTPTSTPTATPTPYLRPYRTEL